MIRRSMRIVCTLVVVALAGGLAFPLAVSRPAAAQGRNLLTNGGFEEPFSQFANYQTAVVANGWTPWWVWGGGTVNRQPEYQPAAPYSNRVRSGGNAQKYFSFYGTHTAGVYQQVSGITPGNQLEFTIWAQAWSSNKDDACCSAESGSLQMKVGIDPTGGTDPFASTVVWSGFKEYYDAWGQLSVRARAQSSTVTVFFYSAPQHPVKHNDVYLDDASLVVTDTSVATTPAPTSAPAAGPTATPVPTATPTPAQVVHLVQPGDTLRALAIRYGVTVDQIVQANGLSNPDLIFVGQSLVISGGTAASGGMAASGEAGTHLVQAGETLGVIAERYDTTVGALASLNGIVNPNLIYAGQALRVPGGGTPAVAPAVEAPSVSAPSAARTHVVQPGENLFRIALNYGIPLDALAAANGISNPALIYVGQTLIIP
jgi:LysM repeat protein